MMITMVGPMARMVCPIGIIIPIRFKSMWQRWIKMDS